MSTVNQERVVNSVANQSRSVRAKTHPVNVGLLECRSEVLAHDVRGMMYYFVASLYEYAAELRVKVTSVGSRPSQVGGGSANKATQKELVYVQCPSAHE